jgi:hypothetical protein
MLLNAAKVSDWSGSAGGCSFEPEDEDEDGDDDGDDDVDAGVEAVLILTETPLPLEAEAAGALPPLLDAAGLAAVAPPLAAALSAKASARYA